MLLVPHTIVGVAVATAVKQPELALVLALFSHFVLDCIPHWDPLVGKLQAEDFTEVREGTLYFILTDFSVAFSLGVFFVYRALPDIISATTILFAAFLANVPDGLMLPTILLGRRWGWLVAYIRFHGRFQTRFSLPWGLLTQAVVVAIGLLITLR